jgi:hypothetical protein
MKCSFWKIFKNHDFRKDSSFFSNFVDQNTNLPLPSTKVGFQADPEAEDSSLKSANL